MSPSPLVSVSLFLVSMPLVVFCSFVCYVPLIDEIIWYLSISTWFISLSIILSSSIHAVMKSRSSFCSIVFHLLMYHSFFIYSFTDGHLGYFQHLAIVNSAAVNIGLHRFFWIGVSGFLGYNPSDGITGSLAVPLLAFWGNSILFSTVAATFWIPTNNALGFPFLCILTSTCCSLIC